MPPHPVPSSYHPTPSNVYYSEDFDQRDLGELSGQDGWQLCDDSTEGETLGHAVIENSTLAVPLHGMRCVCITMPVDNSMYCKDMKPYFPGGIGIDRGFRARVSVLIDSAHTGVNPTWFGSSESTNIRDNGWGAALDKTGTVFVWNGATVYTYSNLFDPFTLVDFSYTVRSDLSLQVHGSGYMGGSPVYRYPIYIGTSTPWVFNYFIIGTGDVFGQKVYYDDISVEKAG